MIKEDDIFKNRKNIYTKNIASLYSQRAENSKLSIRRDQLENYIDAKRLKLNEPINLNDTNTLLLNPEKILNFQDFNLKKDLNLTDILEKLKLLIKNYTNWYEEATILKECITGIRKITCRQLHKESENISKNEIDILLLKILEHYQAFNKYTAEEEMVIHETLWAITNLCCMSGAEIFKQIKTRNTLLVLRSYLYSSVDKILDQTALCLGNIIVETFEYRDIALNLGILDRAVNLSKDIAKPVELIKNCMFLISNILRGRPKPQLEKIAPSLAIISACLWNKDEDIVKSCLWSISYISDGYENIQNTIISTGCLSKVLEYTMINKKDFQLPSLRIIGNLAAGPKKIVERMQNENVLKVLIDLLEISTENYVRIEVLWIIKNFSRSTVDVINTMISYQKMNSVLIKTSDSALEINNENRNDVLNIFYNYAKNGNKYTIKKMIESEIFEYICKELVFIGNINIQHERNKFLVLCLGVLNKILTSSYREKDNDSELPIIIFNLIYKYSLKEKFENLFIDAENNKSYQNELVKIYDLVLMALKAIKLFQSNQTENDRVI